MSWTNTVISTTFLTLGVILVAGGLVAVVIPQQIQPQQLLALANNGDIPNIHASDQARGHCVGICNEQLSSLRVQLQCRIRGSPSCPNLPFQITVTGNDPSPSSFILTPYFPSSFILTPYLGGGSPGDIQQVRLGAGNYTITQQPPSNPDLPPRSIGDLRVIFGGECKQSGTFTATGTIAAGSSQVCIIRNQYS
ncbi:MAG TPA: hypothetical protein VH500_17980 [Nitrososphaeraceae archaeon]|jgi:hypothetical protein